MMVSLAKPRALPCGTNCKERSSASRGRPIGNVREEDRLVTFARKTGWYVLPANHHFILIHKETRTDRQDALFAFAHLVVADCDGSFADAIDLITIAHHVDLHLLSRNGFANVEIE